jgi:L-lactate dehydrogenase
MTGQFEVDGICLSLPYVVDRNGIEAVLQSAPSDEEAQAFLRSAAVLEEVADSSGL